MNGPQFDRITMTFETFLIIIIALYLAQAGVFLFGLSRTKDTSGGQPGFVSVVVAARNEEANLPACLASLSAQTFDPSRFEVIVVNDHSTDRTQSVADEFIRMHPHFRLINAATDPVLKGKTNALNQGIAAAQGDVIMITDADCTVPPAWIEHTAARFTPRVGLVGGFTLQTASDHFTGMQSLDWAFILGMAASMAAVGNPLGSIGNNLSFRKKAYEEIGGYRNLKFSVTEDYTLVQAIIRTGSWDYVYPIDAHMLVESKPCDSWRTLLRQKHRWGKGGLDMKPSGFLIMTIGFLAHLSPFVMLYWGGVVACATALFAKTVGDYLFLSVILTRLNRRADLAYFYSFELYFLLYTLFLPFLALFGGEVIWKDRRF